MALLLKILEQLKSDIDRNEEVARESRGKLHERLDDVLDRIAKMETTVAIAGEIDAQVRTELDGLNQRLGEKGDIGSTVEAWSDLMKTGRRISWLLGIAGITSIGGVIALLAGAWDYLRSFLLRGG